MIASQINAAMCVVRVTKPVCGKSIAIASLTRAKPVAERVQEPTRGSKPLRNASSCTPVDGVMLSRSYNIIYRDLMFAFRESSVGEKISEFEGGWVFTQTSKTKHGFVTDFVIWEGCSATSGQFTGEKIQVSGSNTVPMRAFLDTKQAYCF